MSGDNSLGYWSRYTIHFPPNVIIMMEFQMIKVLKCPRVMEDMDIFLLRPAIIPLTIEEIIIVVTLAELYLCHSRPATLFLAIVDFILWVFIVDVELGIKIPATLPIAITDK